MKPWLMHRAQPVCLAVLMAAASVAVHAQSPEAHTAVSLEEFIARVENNHPKVQQARLIALQARNALTIAWGAYDPKFALSLDQKAYGDDGYYSYFAAAVKVPTPLGADVKAGFERAVGAKINPDRTTPRTGLFSLGLSIPLGQRMITDERRTALRVAREKRDIGDAEQQQLTNVVVAKAAKAFGDWYAAARRMAIAADGVQLAVFRFNAIVERVRAGESAPIDSLEASLEAQRRRVSAREADTELRNARLYASTFLWNANGDPEELAPDALPEVTSATARTTDTTQLDAWLQRVDVRHPEIRIADAKLRMSEADRLLARQAQIPFVEANVASLAGRDDVGAVTSSDRWSANYKLGLDVESSLLLVKERGRASRSGQQVDYERFNREITRRELAYDLRSALNTVVLLEQVIGVQQANVVAATLLRDAEQSRYLSGESTLLIVNLRERTVLDESAKLAGFQGKLLAARAALMVAVGDRDILR